MTTNKDGQALGRKGAESRTRLIAGARRLLAEEPASKLTAASIARSAGLASQTFYLYFAGVDELLLELSREAALDIGEIVAELDREWAPDALREHIARVIDSYYRYWDRHRAVLHIRNFRADGGHPDFVDARSAAALPIVLRIADRIGAAQPGDQLDEEDARARAIIIFSAMERMAARYSALSRHQWFISTEALKRAEADILALLLSPARAGAPDAAATSRI